MDRWAELWIRFVQPGLLVACLAVWSAVALDSLGLISVARCDGPACGSGLAVSVMQSQF